MVAKSLFFIRLENGNGVFLQAENEAEAIEFAGLNTKAQEDSEALDLKRLGLGPQKFTIHEFGNFFAEVKLSDDGDFNQILSRTNAWMNSLRTTPPC